METEVKTQRSDVRLGRKYRFDDPDMDLFFVGALGWGPTGGLEVGQAFYVASQIKDGDADSWVEAFDSYGDLQNAQADTWRERGWLRSAGEMRLKAFAAYRSAWQFAPVGEIFAAIFKKQQQAFIAAMGELGFPAEFFAVPYNGKSLPGVFLQNPDASAPVVLVIGGSDTSFEDTFFTVGRRLFERGYSVALADLPGQGICQADGLYWEREAEKPIGAVLDLLMERGWARAGKIALLGLSLGGYFVTRTAGYETRFATVIASTPFYNPGEMFAAGLRETQANAEPPKPNNPKLRNQRILAWKLGAKTPTEMVDMTSKMIADPSLVTIPFLSILGGAESVVFAHQAHEWHKSIRSERKALVLLDDSTGADGHCQINNRLRLVQEVGGWLDETFDK